MGCCGDKSNDYQLLPSTNPLKSRLNRSLDRLADSVNSEDLSAPIYYYVMTSIRKCGNTLQHYGSGPNWQGGIITLCTCKHFMRALHRPEDWRGLWVAGFSGIDVGDGRNFLIYLMRVGGAFESHWDLWRSLPAQVRSAKAADTNPLGDVYRPIGGDIREDPFNICRYHQPHQSHSHKYDWPRDIKYQKNDDRRRAALLVGDGQYSFIWDKCKIIFDPDNIGRNHRTDNLGDFLHNHLCEAYCGSTL